MNRSAFPAAKPKNTSHRRVLLVHTGTSYGGVDVYLANLVSLLKDDAELHFFCSNPRSRQRLSNLGAIDVRPTWSNCLGRSLSLILFTFSLPLLRVRSRIDTLWAQGNLGILLLPLARILGFHTLLTRHSALGMEALEGIRGIKHHLMELISWRLMRFADRVICVSETVATGMTQIIPKDKVDVVPNWVPGPVGSGKSLSRPSNVLFVGRLERFKGLGLLIEAIRKLNTENRGMVSLTIVGEGKCRIEMERLAEGLPVHFAGFQSDPTPYYQHADLFVNPSINRCEGMPLTSLEAMSFGIPCIFSDLPQNKEILREEKAAILFHVDDVDDLAAKIRTCLRSSDLLKTLRHNAQKLIAAKFSSDVARGRYQHILGPL